MSKTCECFGKVQDAIREQTGDPDAELGAVFTMQGEVFPRMVYTYRKKKKCGEFHTKETEGTMFPTYCPFCGVKYVRGGQDG